MIEIISLLVSVGSAFLTLVTHLEEKNKHKRNNAAQTLSFIGETLDEVVEKFKMNEIPHGACQIIGELSKTLPEVFDGLIDKDKIHELSQKLYEAHNVEQLYLAIQNDNTSLIQLEKAAKHFHLSANLLKI